MAKDMYMHGLYVDSWPYLAQLPTPSATPIVFFSVKIK